MAALGATTPTQTASRADAVRPGAAAGPRAPAKELGDKASHAAKKAGEKVDDAVDSAKKAVDKAADAVKSK